MKTNEISISRPRYLRRNTARQLFKSFGNKNQTQHSLKQPNNASNNALIEKIRDAITEGYSVVLENVVFYFRMTKIVILGSQLIFGRINV